MSRIFSACLMCMFLVMLTAAALNACGSSPTPTVIDFSPTISPPTTDEPATPTIDSLEEEFTQSRRAMVDNQIRSRGVSDKAVLEAMQAVPRHKFVPDDYLDQAYNDHPLPIGYGQTISQPYIVAMMTELLALKPGDRVLEIGTGSGYQAAVLAEITDEVYTIEIIPELAARAQQAFDRLGYDQVKAKQADGYWGWEEVAPFDAIIVTAAPDHVPQPLVNQLADGGKMVIPVGPPGGYQSLWLIERQGDEILRYNWGGVRFVPFTRDE